MSTYPLLEKINAPKDTRGLSHEQLLKLADELRAFVIDSVSKTGGHLSSNLGTVELTLALHHVFNTPYDRLIWDVGHQSYAHKILTGRREQMDTLRQFNESARNQYGTASVGEGIARCEKIIPEKII